MVLSPSDISITAAGSEISDNAVLSGTKFTSQASAQVGNATVLMRDLDRSQSYVTGDEMALTIDSVPMWGGYVTMPTRRFALIQDTSSLSNVTARQFALQAYVYCEPVFIV